MVLQASTPVRLAATVVRAAAVHTSPSEMLAVMGTVRAGTVDAGIVVPGTVSVYVASWPRAVMGMAVPMPEAV